MTDEELYTLDKYVFIGKQLKGVIRSGKSFYPQEFYSHI